MKKRRYCVSHRFLQQVFCPSQQRALIFPGLASVKNPFWLPFISLPDSVPGRLLLFLFHSPLPPWPAIPKELLSIHCSTAPVCAVPPYLYFNEIVTLQLHTYLFFLWLVPRAMHTVHTWNTQLYWFPRKDMTTSPMALSCIFVHVVEVVTLKPGFDDWGFFCPPFVCHPPHLIISCHLPS